MKVFMILFLSSAAAEVPQLPQPFPFGYDQQSLALYLPNSVGSDDEDGGMKQSCSTTTPAAWTKVPVGSTGDCPTPIHSALASCTVSPFVGVTSPSLPPKSTTSFYYFSRDESQPNTCL